MRRDPSPEISGFQNVYMLLSTQSRLTGQSINIYYSVFYLESHNSIRRTCLNPNCRKEFSDGQIWEQTQLLVFASALPAHSGGLLRYAALRVSVPGASDGGTLSPGTV